MLKHIKQVNENSFLLDFGDIIDVAISKYLINFSNYIINDKKNIKKLGIKNCTPSFNKILLQFDPISSSKKKIIKYLEKIEVKKLETKNKLIEIPICYEKEFGIDINEIANVNNLTVGELINIHLNTIFHVYMIGFIPGLPFMGDINFEINIQRKLSPRLSLPKGSVGIVNKLCVIYPNQSPGGWNIIGRTPINLFFKNNKNPLLINPGDRVKFIKISKEQFNKIIEKDE